mmetsp:Transcript_43621/g.100599  ORF Transcript_43621/g.100599 Transcript_43621/m.100599 type:complete len:259 (+) Transcript_43621:173-949(+)
MTGTSQATRGRQTHLKWLSVLLQKSRQAHLNRLNVLLQKSRCRKVAAGLIGAPLTQADQRQVHKNSQQKQQQQMETAMDGATTVGAAQQQRPHSETVPRQALGIGREHRPRSQQRRKRILPRQAGRSTCRCTRPTTRTLGFYRRRHGKSWTSTIPNCSRRSGCVVLALTLMKSTMKSSVKSPAPKRRICPRLYQLSLTCTPCSRSRFQQPWRTTFADAGMRSQRLSRSLSCRVHSLAVMSCAARRLGQGRQLHISYPC